jgi:hypothetical protein
MRERNRTLSSAQGRPRSAAPTALRSSSNRSIALHIEELVLHGFPAHGRHAIGDGAQLELTRLLNSSGLPKFVSSAEQSKAIDGGTFHANPQTKPNQLGKLIANAVYGGRWR